jgi:hypothetical protein
LSYRYCIAITVMGKGKKERERQRQKEREEQRQMKEEPRQMRDENDEPKENENGKQKQKQTDKGKQKQSDKGKAKDENKGSIDPRLLSANIFDIPKRRRVDSVAPFFSDHLLRAAVEHPNILNYIKPLESPRASSSSSSKANARKPTLSELTDKELNSAILHSASNPSDSQALHKLEVIREAINRLKRGKLTSKRSDRKADIQKSLISLLGVDGWLSTGPASNSSPAPVGPASTLPPAPCGPGTVDSPQPNLELSINKCLQQAAKLDNLVKTYRSQLKGREEDGKSKHDNSDWTIGLATSAGTSSMSSLAPAGPATKSSSSPAGPSRVASRELAADYLKFSETLSSQTPVKPEDIVKTLLGPRKGSEDHDRSKLNKSNRSSPAPAVPISISSPASAVLAPKCSPAPAGPSNPRQPNHRSLGLESQRKSSEAHERSKSSKAHRSSPAPAILAPTHSPAPASASNPRQPDHRFLTLTEDGTRSSRQYVELKAVIELFRTNRGAIDKLVATSAVPASTSSSAPAGPSSVNPPQPGPQFLRLTEEIIKPQERVIMTVLEPLARARAAVSTASVRDTPTSPIHDTPTSPVRNTPISPDAPPLASLQDITQQLRKYKLHSNKALWPALQPKRWLKRLDHICNYLALFVQCPNTKARAVRNIPPLLKNLSQVFAFFFQLKARFVSRDTRRRLRRELEDMEMYHESMVAPRMSEYQDSLAERYDIWLYDVMRRIFQGE